MDYGVALKKRHANPSRRSAHHARQERFEGSDRQARGLIVRSLTERPRTERELAEATGLALARIRRVLPGLERDGLIGRRGARLRIA
jgi:A/G-specific adenine glycosylase